MAEVPSYWTVLTMLEWATEYFEEKEVRSPRMSIEWLLADVLQIKRLDLYLKYDRPLSSDELEKLRPMVIRRSRHEPLQYITGETDFLNTLIKVRPGVLIPRSETEQMVQSILDHYPSDTALNVIDLGTGSGCIPIALKKERPEWQLTATDISEEALAIARENARHNETDIHFILDDFLDSKLSDTFDIIISNPPYIEENERAGLDAEVREFEPEAALFCTSTEEIYSGISRFAKKHLKKDGKAYLEISEFQGPKSKNILTENGWNAQLKQDYDNKDRFLVFGH
ncbi:peptide chain release factor N(5)-glutamine methyltransferase [Balneola sp. MJW-20]|uniref:peptide chain release factor N(5)-glutamine methyltransferase n=1 Tax=Gracilimonas aurantiaca TaxID=3234185 RepID=UPI0034650076